MPRKPPIGKSLAEVNPELAKQWHPTKNGDLTPYDVYSASGIKVWWKCFKNNKHFFLMNPNDRKRGRGCSLCSGNVIDNTNCLAITNPDLAKQWHPNKNGNLTAYDLTIGSGVKVWWKCDKGDDHIWLAPPLDRKNGQNCGICAGKIIVDSNSIKTTHPLISNEWHPEKNGELTPNDVSKGSHLNAWWVCKNGCEYVSTVKHRCGKKATGCPNCAEYGFSKNKLSFFYIRILDLGIKKAIKYGVTNQMDGNREGQQRRKLHDFKSFKTIYKSNTYLGNTTIKVENKIKKKFGFKGYLNKDEMPDGFTETIKYSKNNINKIKLIVDEFLNEENK